MPRPYTLRPCGIYGPRNLIRRHARRVKQSRKATLSATPGDGPPTLATGQEQLFSFWVPSLEAGEYTVSVTQELTSDTSGETLNLPEANNSAVTQVFDVVAPRYSLPDTAIHSSFPPQGYGALGNTLPHVVLTDPHLPWARFASAKPAQQDPDYGRNAVPWLAVLLFTQDELMLSPQTLSSVFSKTSLASSAQQTQTMAVNMPVADIALMQNTTSPMLQLKPEPTDDASANVILLPSALFQELTTSYDSGGAVVSPQSAPDVSRYKYMAHARDIDTTGMPDAGVEDNGIFGIVVSHRTGPLSNQQPQPVFAHLVSIEGVENMAWPIGSDYAYVAMTSLYSWSFVTLPDSSFNIETTLSNLGTSGMGLLGAPQATLSNVDTSTKVGQRLKSRLTDGYTMTRYRTVTGEETVAMYRGPFTPTKVPYPLTAALSQQTGLTSCWLSDSGIDLQIMDPEVGLMDITYAVAWQLGKTLAVADKLFTTALGRLRTAILSQTMADAKATIMRQHGSYETRNEAVKGINKTLTSLNQLHRHSEGLHAPHGSMADRWRRPQQPRLDLSYGSPLVQPLFGQLALKNGRRLMLSSDGDGTQLYDELNTPESDDWMLVLKWVLDKMLLYSIPAHYLILDPAFLPDESLRFFNVDRNWTDALIDGALSLGNHTGSPDQVRFTIHQMIQEYLNPPSSSSSSPASTATTSAPPTPVYGFMMRSDAVTKYPDLKVTVELSGSTPSGDADALSILRLENLDASKGVMLCLLAQEPGPSGIQSLTFTEPPHQQSFIAAAALSATSLQTLYKHIFTAAAQTPNPASVDTYSWTRQTDNNEIDNGSSAGRVNEGDALQHAQAVFKWGSQSDPEVRTLLPTSWAADVSAVLNYHGQTDGTYVDSVPNAAMAGIQLNNPIYRLKIATQDSTTGEKSSNQSHVFPFPPVSDAVTAPKAWSELAVQSSKPAHGETLGAARVVEASANLSQLPRVGSGFELGPSHGYPSCRPPHYRVVPEMPARTPQTKPSQPGTPSAPPIPPDYTFSVLPVDNDPANPGIPSGTGIPKDLVFSVLQQPDANPDYNLNEMQIWLQIANTAQDAPYCLFGSSNYTGPGPYMISNVRFVAIAQTQPPTSSDPNSYLVLRIIPRSTTGAAATSMCTDLSLILPVCTIPLYDPTKVPFIPIKWLAIYNGNEDGTFITDSYAIRFAAS